MLSTVGLRHEPVGLALSEHTFCAAFLPHGRSDNGKGHVEGRHPCTDTSSYRSAPTEHEGFRAADQRLVGP